MTESLSQMNYVSGELYERRGTSTGGSDFNTRVPRIVALLMHITDDSSILRRFFEETGVLSSSELNIS